MSKLSSPVFQILFNKVGTFNLRSRGIMRITFSEDLTEEEQDIISQWLHNREEEIEVDWRDDSEVEIYY